MLLWKYEIRLRVTKYFHCHLSKVIVHSHLSFIFLSKAHEKRM